MPPIGGSGWGIDSRSAKGCRRGGTSAPHQADRHLRRRARGYRHHEPGARASYAPDVVANEELLARETIAARLADLGVEGEIVILEEGAAAGAIVRLAEERKAGLFVAGTQGRWVSRGSRSEAWRSELSEKRPATLSRCATRRTKGATPLRGYPARASLAASRLLFNSPLSSAAL